MNWQAAFWLLFGVNIAGLLWPWFDVNFILSRKKYADWVNDERAIPREPTDREKYEIPLDRWRAGVAVLFWANLLLVAIVLLGAGNHR